MLREGTPLLLHVGFSKQEKPFLFLQVENKMKEQILPDIPPTFEFDTAHRYCVGWHDLDTGENHLCPDSLEVDKKFDQCPACQKRTGFNPAFYNATHISAKQQERNKEPHVLYLAHFGRGIIKVGISHAKRKAVRLLEQGARSAVVLDTFPTANIARQYEAKIAALPTIVETLQLKKKIELLKDPYDRVAAAQELSQAQRSIETALSCTFHNTNIRLFDDLYFFGPAPSLKDVIDVTDQAVTSGNMLAMLGTLLISEYHDTSLCFQLKKYTGYPLKLSHNKVDITLPSRQISLF